jgi:UDP-N-acetylglucosamine:LPS N-acetylglucosamine transferase
MRRVLIVTASMGAGHTEVGSELARRLRTADLEVDVVDVLTLPGSSGERLRRTYQLLLRRAPWIYDGAMRWWLRHPAAMAAISSRFASGMDEALGREVNRRTPDVVVSTYNLAAQALGRLRRDGAVTAPLITVVTDAGAHPYWVNDHVALHIAHLPETAARLVTFGAPRVAVAPPLLRPQFTSPGERPGSRSRVGLPATRRIVLVTAGSWAAGRIRRTISLLRSESDALVVVLCGRDARLVADLGARADVHAVGWTDQMPEYLRAADVVVDNAGGLTCWEALACRTPVVMFDPLPGHGRLNAATLSAAGLVELAKTPRELGQAVQAREHPASPAFLHNRFAEVEEHVMTVGREVARAL